MRLSSGVGTLAVWEVACKEEGRKQLHACLMSCSIRVGISAVLGNSKQCLKLCFVEGLPLQCHISMAHARCMLWRVFTRRPQFERVQTGIVLCDVQGTRSDVVMWHISAALCHKWGTSHDGHTDVMSMMDCDLLCMLHVAWVRLCFTDSLISTYGT